MYICLTRISIYPIILEELLSETSIWVPRALEKWGEGLFFQGTREHWVIIFGELGSKLIVLGIYSALPKGKN